MALTEFAPFVDYARTTIADVGGISDVETEITLTDDTNFPDPAVYGEYPIVVGRVEICTVTALAASVLTVTRDVGGTNQAHDEGAPVERNLTASDMSAIHTAVNALEAAQWDDAEHFWGDAIPGNWDSATSGTGAAVALGNLVGGVVDLAMGTQYFATATFRLGTSSYEQFSIALNPVIEFRVKAALPTDANSGIWFGISNGSNYIAPAEAAFFMIQKGVNSDKWFSRTRHSSTSEDKDTAVSPDSNYHTFKIEVTSATSVKFYVDGTLKTTHVTQMPTGAMHVFIIAVQLGNPGTNDHAYVDRVSWKQDLS